MDEQNDPDTQIRNFLLSAPRDKLYSELAREIVKRFGADRAWSRQQIFDLLNEEGIRQKCRSRIYNDPEVRDFIEDRLGRRTLREIESECRQRFGESRTPSKTAIHRHWARMRSF